MYLLSGFLWDLGVFMDFYLALDGLIIANLHNLSSPVVRNIKIVMENKLKYIQVSTTVAKRSDAERIAKILSKQKLSACTQIIGPITSIYRWKGKIEKSKEWLCIVKTGRSQYKTIEKAIKSIHPYELPEIIATPIIEGNREYLGWVQKEIKKILCRK